MTCAIRVDAETFDQLLAAVDAEKAKRAAAMPTEQDAINAIQQAYHRLKDLGWNDIQYCPKDGSEFDSIEIGSTGIHPTYYWGEWPKGSWMVADGGDLWPSHPALFRTRVSDEHAKREDPKGLSPQDASAVPQGDAR